MIVSSVVILLFFTSLVWAAFIGYDIGSDQSYRHFVWDGFWFAFTLLQLWDNVRS